MRVTEAAATGSPLITDAKSISISPGFTSCEPTNVVDLCTSLPHSTLSHFPLEDYLADARTLASTSLAGLDANVATHAFERRVTKTAVKIGRKGGTVRTSSLGSILHRLLRLGVASSTSAVDRSKSHLSVMVNGWL
ncbi:hypothetical protein KPH14_007561 [Odynerus spinipes]|uniref:Uncharacterized protein n=1 Tax=Odynerus spinipes TaxID=1348599 RepID=A0AAD9RI43_9HYME|nr:hypothetical protein KPH14_007561 [Odynerus spinipes]